MARWLVTYHYGATVGTTTVGTTGGLVGEGVGDGTGVGSGSFQSAPPEPNLTTLLLAS